MNYSPQNLQNKLAAAITDLAATRKFLIGLSGGLDSVVLLHGMAALREQAGSDFQLRAIHINHQLQDQAELWQQHCLSLCEQLGVEFVGVKVEVPGSSGIENAARDARYSAFEAQLGEDEELLLAHHRDDQMETLLLRLMRGSGSRGLSGIPSARALGASRLLRPMLQVDREELCNYAKAAQLDWVEDHSNADLSFDRNYCRHTLLPLIEERWPGYRESWSKSAMLASENEALNRELAEIDMARIATDSESAVSRDVLLALSEPRRRNVLRHWLAAVRDIDLGWSQLQQLSNEVLPSATGQFIGEGFQIFCYRDQLSIVASEELDVLLDDVEVDAMPNLLPAASAPLPDNGELRISENQGDGIARDLLDSLSVRYRRGGESCRLAGRPSKSLKKLLQELEVPPWLRSRVPLLYAGNELAYIPGIGVCEAFAAKAGEPACRIEWQQPEGIGRL
jgi:tRNA(Ile)-lysidine synthase